MAARRIRTRSVTKSEALSWASLPAEVRLLILEEIAHRRHRGWASFAAVCREWQHVIEKANFHKLCLRVPCLDDFARIASPQKQALIHHLCLDVELPPYKSTCCAPRASRPVPIRCIVSKAIWKLFSILSTWDPAGSLALEINVYSCSDCEHFFKNFYLSSDYVQYAKGTAPDLWGERIIFHDPPHGWSLGAQVRSPPRLAMLRLFRPIHLRFRQVLPQVGAVTSLIIRRQLRRCIAEYGLGLLLRSLSRLEHLCYEPWVPAFFASKSRSLQHLAISFMVDADDLFQRCQPTWSWWHLQSIALTSQLLRVWKDRGQIETLLCRAGVLVQKMPKLHTFVLWNGGKSHACAFIYRIDRDRPSVTWRGTWNLELTSPVVQSWQCAASRLRRHELQLKQEHIQEYIACHGDAIYHLELPCQVVDPASLWQIRREGRG
ncbi:hypothetical protein EKO27_g5197 [Xylaria grammica]|uniref:DUF6546 domain-containing protein n=1 Tax=Xylaria grammica TaxID=363999 RepID=A0A439D678_9PEZI|nr:hypothetical protein EKO27_g5197 [Xylaria grammica]